MNEQGVSASALVSWWPLRPDQDAADPVSLADYLREFGLCLVPANAFVGGAAEVALIDARASLDPDLDDAMAAARAQGQAIVVLLAWGSPSERADVLDRGADDCMVAPIDRRELAARILSVRRGQVQRQRGLLGMPWLRFGPWLLDTGRRCVSNAQSETISLSHAEYQVLLALLGAPYQVVSYDSLLGEALSHGAEDFDRCAIDLLVFRLRDKLGDDPVQPRLIQTIRGQGYVLNAVPSTPTSEAGAWSPRSGVGPMEKFWHVLSSQSSRMPWW